jgi:hypothetical protein
MRNSHNSWGLPNQPGRSQLASERVAPEGVQMLAPGFLSAQILPGASSSENTGLLVTTCVYMPSDGDTGRRVADEHVVASSCGQGVRERQKSREGLLSTSYVSRCLIRKSLCR